MAINIDVVVSGSTIDLLWDNGSCTATLFEYNVRVIEGIFPNGVLYYSENGGTANSVTLINVPDGTYYAEVDIITDNFVCDQGRSQSFNVQATPVSYQLTVNRIEPTSGSVTINGNTASPVSIVENNSVTLVASPVAGFVFAGYTFDGVVVSTSTNYTFSMPSSNTTALATFNESTASYQLTLNILEPTSGSVTINGNTASPVSILESSSVILLASPVSGFVFEGYTIDGVVVSNSTNYNFSMPSSNTLVVATFSEVPPPTQVGQESIYDTSRSKFYFIRDLSDRFFTGDVVNLTQYTLEEVIEPVDFDTGMFKLERDKDYHGFNYEFSIESLRYELGTTGHNYLNAQLLLRGTDVDIKFVYGFGEPSEFTIFYVGKVDMNEYAETDDGEYIKFTLRELDFDNLLQTAFDVTQEVVPNTDVLLYSKVIPEKVTYTIPKANISETGTPYPRAIFDQVPAGSPAGIITGGVFTPIVATIFVNAGRQGDDTKLFTTYPFQLDINKNPQSELAGFKFLFRAEQAGFYKLIVKTSLLLGLGGINGFFENNPDFQFCKLIIRRTKADGITQTGLNIPPISRESFVAESQGSDGSVVLVFDHTQQFNNIEVDECVYAYFEINSNSLPNYNDTNSSIFSVFATPFKGDPDQAQITVLAETLEKSSKSRFIDGYTLLNETFKKAGDFSYDIVRSDFIETGGCASLLYFTNGFGVRGVTEETSSKIKTSPKKLIDSYKNLFNIGWGVEYNENKEEIVRVEPTEYFYQDVEIFRFENISDYSKEVDSSLYYNEIEVGFKHYSKQRETDKGNTIDDFHTKHTYQTPIKTNKNKLSIVTDFVLSGYEIEITRRKQFEESGKSDNSNFKEDEELFGVQLISNNLFSGGTYIGLLTDLSDGQIISVTGDSIIIVGYAYFYTGQEVSVQVDDGAIENNSIRFVQYGFITPQGFTFPVFATLIYFTGSIISPSSFQPKIVVSTKNGESYLVPESNQPFAYVANMLSTVTAYNLRYSPKRMLLNWAKSFNGGFFGKDSSEQILFKQGDGNILLETRFTEEETCRLGDIDRDTIVEGGSVIIGEIYNRGLLWYPFKVSFSTSLTFKQLTTLKNCLRGNSGSLNYGYITIPDPLGGTQQIFIDSISYSGVTDEAIIEGRLKEFSTPPTRAGFTYTYPFILS